MWQVPHEDGGAHGGLLSDRIRLYVDAVHLIEPETFVEESIRPASYDLHVGDEYYVNDKRVPLDANGQLEIPANGLVYIATSERFNIPYYMVARYSLQVTQVYRGLLIENGLQIDPGYQGRIFVAVHNFTDQPRSLSRGDPFLSIEFGHTTPLPPQVDHITSEEELVSLAGTGKLHGVDGNPIRLFAQSVKDLRKERTPPHFWKKRPGERHESSLLGMERRNRALHDETKKTVRQIQFISIGAVLVLLVALVPWISQRYLDTERAVRPIEEKIKVLDSQLQEQRASEQKQIQERLDALEKEIGELRPTPPSIRVATSSPSSKKAPPNKIKP